MAKPVFQLVRKHGAIASQNKHLKRSVYSGMFPNVVTESVEGIIKVPVYAIQSSEMVLSKSGMHQVSVIKHTSKTVSIKEEIKILRYLITSKGACHQPIPLQHASETKNIISERRIFRFFATTKASMFIPEPIKHSSNIKGIVSVASGIYAKADDAGNGLISVPILEGTV